MFLTPGPALTPTQAKPKFRFLGDARGHTFAAPDLASAALSMVPVEQLLKLIADHPEWFDEAIHLPCELRAVVEALRDQRNPHIATRGAQFVLVPA